jgi:hypothetical protein
MKFRTTSMETLAQVIAVPGDKKTDLGVMTDAEIGNIRRRNETERRGFVFVGERDGSDVYIDLKTEKSTLHPYENAA